MPYEPFTGFLPPNPDGAMHHISIVPRRDKPGADLELCHLPEILIEEPCHFLGLPLEVLTNILHQIEDKADLYALLRAAPRLYNVIMPILWKHLTINLRSDRYPESETTDLSLLLKARSPELDRLQFVKSVVVKGTSPPSNWCIHRNPIYGRFFENMSKDIAGFLRHLQTNSLKHFSWTTGTCMADALISPWGCLTTTQRDLEELKLVLSAKCPDQQTSLYLGSFRKLKYLSLRGLKYQPKAWRLYQSLETMLLASCSTLVEFELAVVPSEDEAPYPGTLDGKHIFPIHPNTDGFLFSNLRALHLEMVSLSGCAARLVQTIDVASMTSLTLRQCEGWDDFCKLMTQGNRPLSLCELELEYLTADFNSNDCIINLLNLCSKIETVSICDGCECSEGIALKMWKSLCHGRPSLRRLVYHQTDFIDKADCLGPTVDPRGEIYIIHQLLNELSECISSPEANPFTNSNLDFLGICCFPTDMLVGILRPLAKQNRLRVIHFRKSAYEMNAIMSLRRAIDRFVVWALGCNGIPSLEVVLFGDFSVYRAKKGVNCRYTRNEGQYPGYNVKVDPDISDLPAPYLSMAKACPSQFTM